MGGRRAAAAAEGARPVPCTPAEDIRAIAARDHRIGGILSTAHCSASDRVSAKIVSGSAMGAFRDRDDAARSAGRGAGRVPRPAAARARRASRRCADGAGSSPTRSTATSTSCWCTRLARRTQPELAIGAVDEHGHVVPDDLAREPGVAPAVAQALAAREVEALRARQRRSEPAHRSGRPGGHHRRRRHRHRRDGHGGHPHRAPGRAPPGRRRHRR